MARERGQLAAEWLLMMVAIVLPFAGGAAMWIYMIGRVFARSAKLLALPFP